MWTFLEFYFLKFFKNRLTWNNFQHFPNYIQQRHGLGSFFLDFLDQKCSRNVTYPFLSLNVSKDVGISVLQALRRPGKMSLLRSA